MGLFSNVKSKVTHKRAKRLLKSRRAANALTIGYAKDKKGRVKRRVSW